MFGREDKVEMRMERDRGMRIEDKEFVGWWEVIERLRVYLVDL